MITGIDLNEVIDYTSNLDKGDDKTVFKISPISSPVKARISKLAGLNGENSLESLIEAFKTGVKNIVNLKDKSGTIIPFSENVLERIPLEVVIDVGAKIMRISSLSEEEAKN